MNKALIAVIDAVRTRVSTSEVIVALAIPLEQAELVSKLLQNVGHQVGVAFAEVDNQQGDQDYGDMSATLMLSSFFRSANVWEAIGTDEQYLEWLRTQPCAYCGDHDFVNGTGLCEAAHVRRVANGSGASIKPKYSAIPLCRTHHRKQHNEGESALGSEDWWRSKRISYIRRWCKLTLKSILGYESWKYIPPSEVYDWAEKHGVENLLPKDYIDD